MVESESRCQGHWHAALRGFSCSKKNFFFNADMPQQTLSKFPVGIEIQPFGIRCRLLQKPIKLRVMLRQELVYATAHELSIVRSSINRCDFGHSTIA